MAADGAISLNCHITPSVGDPDSTGNTQATAISMGDSDEASVYRKYIRRQNLTRTLTSRARTQCPCGILDAERFLSEQRHAALAASGA